MAAILRSDVPGPGENQGRVLNSIPRTRMWKWDPHLSGGRRGRRGS